MGKCSMKKIQSKNVNIAHTQENFQNQLKLNE